MKKQWYLIYNELLKQTKKMSTKVIALIIVLLAIALPLVSEKMSENSFGESTVKTERSYVTSQLENVKGDKSDIGVLSATFYEKQLNLLNKMDDTVTSWNDYRMDSFYAYTTLLQELLVFQADEADLTAEEIATAMYYGDLILVNELLALEGEAREARIQELSDQLTHYEDIIESNDYTLYIENESLNVKTQLEFTKQEITQLEKQLADKSLSPEEVIRSEVSLTYALQNKERCEALLAMHDFIMAENIQSDFTDWRFLTIQEMMNQTNYVEFEKLTEAAFKQEYGGSLSHYTYEDYAKEFDVSFKIYTDLMQKGWYSLTENMAQLEYTTDARTTTLTLYEVFTSFSVLFSIIIGGSIVSQEFSTGTIRLLLIRPVKRSKVLFAKMAAVLSLGIVSFLLGFIILFITSGMVHGFETYALPVLTIQNEMVLEQSFFSFLISRFSMSVMSLVFVSLLAICLSTTLRHTAFSVAVCTMVYLGAFPVLFILGSFGSTWVGHTLIPYINTSFLNLAPVLKDLLEVQFKITLNMQVGALYLAIASALCAAIAFIHFNKADINN